VPAITELIELDSSGNEQLKVSRLAMDVVGSGKDYSQEPSFINARKHRVWFGPVYFRKESEPYMTLAMAEAGRNAGVTVAEVNLKLIWDVITGLKIGEHSYAYVVDRDGRLIADPDISLVLRNTDLAKLPQVAAALAETTGGPTPAPMAMVAKGINGNSVLTAHAPIAPLGWTVFVELPLSEALVPLYGSALRTAALLAFALGLAILAALFLARRMVGPIRLLQASAARVGAGELDRRIDIQTGDELEELAGEFNRMADDLQKSYADLEGKVEERTAELKEALDQQTATAEVLGVINSSPGDLGPVFNAMLEKAVNLCGASFGLLMKYDGEAFQAVAHYNSPPAFVELLRQPIRPAPGMAGYRILRGEDVVAFADVGADPTYAAASEVARRLVETSGARTHVTIALRKDGNLLGQIVIYHRQVRPFTDKQIALLQNFAAQAVIAMENARLLSARRSTSRLRPRRYCKSSTRRPATSRRSSTQCWKRRRISARPRSAFCGPTTATRWRLQRFWARHRVTPSFFDRGRALSARRTSACNAANRSSRSPTFHPTRGTVPVSRWRVRSSISVASAQFCWWRCAGTRRRSGLLPFIASRCGRSQRNRSRFCRTSQRRRSSPWRMRGF